jgi:hypothetical protein
LTLCMLRVLHFKKKCGPVQRTVQAYPGAEVAKRAEV